ncbi:hypothetical protein [Mesorhizobium sp. ES1-3]|uniref:hypothetical protein n=1 Tax=Mesorhizobium sp. ES1-3 TaxID=2876628 RepID=UPI001CC9C417|nr:hypothetical protein [Mesorhizobium sp. ES1-3]MBZ9673793.1 hypothetical protein [Mesorhizobium sp. ES1-3]
MNMQAYLHEIEHAVTGSLTVVWAEHERLRPMMEQLDALRKHTEAEYARAQALIDDPLFDDDEGLGTFTYWDTYFGVDKRLHEVSVDAQELKQHIDAHTFSIAAMSGAILQFAKQGLSIVHGALDNCPAGRQIGSQTLSTIVFQARNQSIHWEEGALRKPVVDCFNALTNDFDHKFSAFTVQSLAFQVIALLGWKSYQAFHEDMMLMA